MGGRRSSDNYYAFQSTRGNNRSGGLSDGIRFFLIIFILLIAIGCISLLFGPKCPRCNEPWDYDGYCFRCQAEIKGYYD